MNKRFKIKLSDIGELMDCDTQSILAVSSIANELIPLCELLNNLADENEQLKKQLKKKEVEPIIDKLKEMEMPYGYYSDSKADVRLKELFKSDGINCTEHWDGEH